MVIDLSRVPKYLALRLLKRKREDINELLHRIGGENIKWMIENKSRFADHFPLEGYSQDATRYSWAITLLKPDDIWGVLEQDIKDVILSANGRKWFDTQVEYLVKLLS